VWASVINAKFEVAMLRWITLARSSHVMRWHRDRDSHCGSSNSCAAAGRGRYPGQNRSCFTLSQWSPRLESTCGLGSRAYHPQSMLRLRPGGALHFDDLDQARSRQHPGRLVAVASSRRPLGNAVGFPRPQPTHAPLAQARAPGRQPASADLSSADRRASERIRTRGPLSPLVNCIVLSAIATRWRV
jgi:hypothetical protein